MALWTPADITTALWIDFADQSTLFDATSGGSAVTNGVGIARAEDKSGNSRHFTQGTSGAMPTWSGGRASFDGGDWLTANTTNPFAFMHQSGGGSVFMVVQIGSSSNPNAAYDLIGNNGASVNNQGFFLRFDDRSAFSINNAITSGMRNSLTGGSGDDFYFSGVNDVATPNTLLQVGLQTDPGNAIGSAKIRKRVDGNADFGNNATTRNPSTANPTFALQIGSSGNATLLFVGLIGEVIMLSGVPSTADRQTVEGYLAHKWGLTASLPSDHPYKSAAPVKTLKTNLVWYWDLSSADATITDQHSGLALSRIGTTTTESTGGPDGGPCISFGALGGNKYSATVAKTISYDDGYTVNIWARSTGSSTGNWLINHRGAGSGNSLYFQMVARVSNLDIAQTFDNSVSLRQADASQVNINTWQMLTLRDTGAVTELYRNGSLVGASSTALGARSTGSAPLAIGGNAWSVNTPLDHRGQLAMAGVWNEPLSQAAITALYNGGNGRRYADLNIPIGVFPRRRRSRSGGGVL